MIYTSRYANKRIDNSDFYVVAISLGRPRFSTKYRINRQVYMLAPDKSMWGKTHEEFTKLYTGKLERIGAKKIAELLNELQQEANGKDVVLLCFEDIRKPDTFCHRTTFAEWCREHLNENISELEDESEVKIAKKAKKIVEEAISNSVDEGFVQMSIFSLV